MIGPVEWGAHGAHEAPQGGSLGRLAGLLVGTWLVAHIGCSLPAEDKTGCSDSTDCIDHRICDDGECRPGACEPLCTEVCQRRDECEQAGSDCLSQCLLEHGTSDGTSTVPSEDDCKDQWDLLEANPDCAATACMAHCRDLCTVAASCKLIADATACTVGCQQIGTGCDEPLPADCTDVPSAVQCWETGGCDG